ncbi:hypothetical protein BDB00DRAFT_818800 [Zychaea mexicana]|uniref:uncharacterized protein n=1 Tax=Zychaea mexicana TaxID=64656 RepID=UPI0022FE4316|nr:uncharacterized protein BDB00DRAFT_818800 [Zychaea mexicana]KAI9494343.1 hypothetical protein BDB00DRAFT_818800 [Zychaea mexicana]
MTIGTQTDPVLKRNTGRKGPVSFLTHICELEKRQYFSVASSYRTGSCRPFEKQKENHYTPINGEVEYMITNSLDAGHYEGALKTIEEAIIAKRRCTRLVISYLFDLILRPGQAYERLSPQEVLSMSRKAHHMLLMILETFGTSAFADIWELFQDNKRPSRRMRKRTYRIAMNHDDNEDEEGEVYVSALTEFDTFQEFFACCVEYTDDFNVSKKQVNVKRGPSMRAPAAHLRRKLVLDVLLSLLEEDLYQTEGDPSLLESCVLVKLVNSGRDLQRWLDVIFSSLGADLDQATQSNSPSTRQNTVCAEFGARMLNMLVAASYCESAFDLKDLEERSCRRLAQLGIEGCSNMMQMIRFNTFKFTILDKVISDADRVNVQQQCKSMRKQKASPNFMDKFIKFDLKTQPNQLVCMEDVYRHVQILTWKYILGINLRQVHQNQRNSHNDGNAMDTSTSVGAVTNAMLLDETPTLTHTTISAWKRHIDDMIRDAEAQSIIPELEDEMKRKIHWTVSLVENIMV